MSASTADAIDEYSGKELAMFYFDLVPGQDIKSKGLDWQCVCGVIRRQSGNGYTNLTSHVLKKHPNYAEEIAVSRATGNYHAIKDEKSKNGINAFIPVDAYKYFSWIEWICVDLLPFSFVERELTRKYTKLDKISVESLLKYMNLLCERVEKDISKELPKVFAIMFDGWSADGYHYVANFATYVKDGVVKKRLLGFSPIMTSHVEPEEGEHDEVFEMKFDASAYSNLLNETFIVILWKINL
jgi:hypothetical protein